MIRRILAVVCVALAGCAANQPTTSPSTTWVGAPLTELEAAWGPPNQVSEQGDDVVLVAYRWKQEVRGLTNEGEGGRAPATGAATMDRTCNVIFLSQSGTIKEFKETGTSCGWFLNKRLSRSAR